MSFARDVLEPILRDMSGGLGSMFGLNLTDVLQSPEEYSALTAALMVTISDTIVMPAATLILVVLFMLELVRIGMRTDGDGETFAKTAFFTLVKFVMLKLIFESTHVVMQGIYALFAEMASQANTITAVTTGVGSDQLNGFLTSVDDMDWLGQTVLIIFMLLAWLVNKGAMIAALALVVVRFVKLYIFAAFAPAPIAMFATQETRTFGVGFLRNYAAIVLQALVLVLAFAIYQTVTSTWAGSAFANLDGNAVTAALSISGSFIMMGVVLGMVVLGSGRIASELLGN